jgi:succinoglycan biosynthesis transport protein ExoP
MQQVNTSLDQSLKHILEYGRFVLRYKWLVLVGSLVLTVVFTILIARLPNVYQATTTILVDPQQIPEKYVSPAVSSDPGDRLNILTQQVLSRTRLQEIVDELNPYPDLRGRVSPEELIDVMRHDITIQVKQGSGPELSTFTITYEGRRPSTVALVANKLAGSFIKWNVSNREQLVQGTKEFLSSELQEAKHDLEQQEDKLRRFKMSHLGETPDQTNNNLQALSGLRSSLQAAQEAMNRLDEEKILLTQLPQPIPATGSAGLTEDERLEQEKRQLEGDIEQLRLQYSDRYPDVVRMTHRLDSVKAKLAAHPAETMDRTKTAEKPASATTVHLELVDKEMKRLKAEQAKMQAQISGYQAKLDAAPMREQELIELTRNYDTSKQHYQALLDKSFSISMASDLEQKQKAERFTVLDPAQVPVVPSKPKRAMLIPVSTLAALGFAIFAVVAKEVISPAIKTESELKSLLPTGIRVAGFIPAIRTAADDRADRRLATIASAVCVVLFLIEAGVLWKIHLML